jgi:hypothetical protein
MTNGIVQRGISSFVLLVNITTFQVRCVLKFRCLITSLNKSLNKRFKYFSINF